MIEDNTYEENVKDFNRMLFKLDDKDFNWDMHIMIDLVVEQIEAEYTMNCMVDDSNVIHINRFRDVLKWADHQKFECPGGSIPPLSCNNTVCGKTVSGKTTSKRRKPYAAKPYAAKPYAAKQLVIPLGSGFAIGRDGRRRRKKYL